VPEVGRSSNSRVALKQDLDLEANQLERYRGRFAQANELGLPDVAEALRPLLEQTQEYVQDCIRLWGLRKSSRPRRGKFALALSGYLPKGPSPDSQRFLRGGNSQEFSAPAVLISLVQ
jgi:hypothetical protein